MKYGFITILILLATSQSSRANENTQTENYNNLIVGSWVAIKKNKCGSNQVVYKTSGLKIAILKYCDKTGLARIEWYKSNWSIDGSTIKEVTFKYSSGLAKTSSVTLPHTEVDQIVELTESKLTILDQRGEKAYTRITRRPQKQKDTKAILPPLTQDNVKSIVIGDEMMSKSNNSVTAEKAISGKQNDNTHDSSTRDIVQNTSGHNDKNTPGIVTIRISPISAPDNLAPRSENKSSDLITENTTAKINNSADKKPRADEKTDLLSQLIQESRGDKAEPDTRKNSNSQVFTADLDQDGQADYLKYNVKNNNGYSITVFDYEMDGQADQKLYLPADPDSQETGFIKIWHKGKWYRAMLKDKKLGILVDDSFISGNVLKSGRIILADP